MLSELDRRADADDQRVAAAAEGAGAQGRRARAHHGQPRRDGRRDLRGDERRRLPRRPRARRDRGGAGGRAPGEGQLRGQAGRERGPDRPSWRGSSANRRHAPLHRVHGGRGDERLADDDVVPAGRDRLDDRQRVRRRAGRRSTAARSPSAGATRTARARSASSPRSPSRSAATAPARGSPPRKALHLPLRRPRARPARAAPERRDRRGARRRASARSGASAATATRSSAPRTPSTLRSASPRSRCRYIGGSRAGRRAEAPAEPTPHRCIALAYGALPRTLPTPAAGRGASRSQQMSCASVVAGGEAVFAAWVGETFSPGRYLVRLLPRLPVSARRGRAPSRKGVLERPQGREPRDGVHRPPVRADAPAVHRPARLAGVAWTPDLLELRVTVRRAGAALACTSAATTTSCGSETRSSRKRDRARRLRAMPMAPPRLLGVGFPNDHTGDGLVQLPRTPMPRCRACTRPTP